VVVRVVIPTVNTVRQDVAAAVVESPAAKWTAKSDSNSTGVTTSNGYAETHSHSYKENYAVGIYSI